MDKDGFVVGFKDVMSEEIENAEELAELLNMNADYQMQDNELDPFE